MREPENLRKLLNEINPDFVGFIFHPGSPRYFLDGPEEIPAGLAPEKRTGVFVNSSFEEVTGLAEMFNIKNIQLHGGESPQFCSSLKKAGYTVIKAFGIKTVEDFQQMNAYEEFCDFFLFDTKTPGHGGSGKKFNWEMLNKIEISKPYFLSGGIDADDVDGIKNLRQNPFAIDINSRFEIMPGLKDIEKIKTFKNQLFNHE
jgi:phosphoribosylanthranilate isomerase